MHYFVEVASSRTSCTVAADYAAVAPVLVPLDDGVAAVGPSQTGNGEDAHRHHGDDGPDRDGFAWLSEQHCVDDANEDSEPDGRGAGFGDVDNLGEHLCLQVRT